MVVEFLVGTEHKLEEGNVEDGKRITVDATPEHVQADVDGEEFDGRNAVRHATVEEETVFEGRLVEESVGEG